MKQATKYILPLLLFISGITSAEPKSQTPANETLHSLKVNKQIPAQSLYQLMAAEMALDREQLDVALVNYIAAAKETQDPAIAARATQIALGIASLEDAVEPAGIWAKGDPDNLEAQITSAAILIRLNKVPQAIPFLRQAEKLNPNEAFQYYLILFRQLQKEEDRKNVISALELLAQEETTIMSAHLALAEIFLFLGKDAAALEFSQKAIEQSKDSIVAIQLYTESLMRNKGKIAAKEFLSKNINENPDNRLLKQYYAQFMVENGFDKEGRLQIEALLKNKDLTSQELLQFARLCMQVRWFDLANKTLKRASTFPESKDLSYYFLARVAEMQNNDKEAVEWFKQVLTGPFHILSQVRASILLSEKQQYDEALTLLSRAQATDLNDKKQLVLAKAEILNKAKRYPESYQLLEENMKFFPNDIEIYYARSLALIELGKIDLAEKDLKAILSIQPNHVDALNTLGYILVNKTQRLDEANRYLTTALDISPENPSVLDSLGWLSYKMGNYDKAIELLQKSLNIRTDAEVAAHLGEVLWKTKDFEGAKRVWNNALSNHPKHEQILKVMHRLVPTETNAQID